MSALDNPLVTIITPSFNQGQFLEQTIQSVLNQTYKNIEYLIIDGGFSDNSVEIIKKYASKLAYWQSEKDKGQASAINLGYQKSKGQIVAYLNSDDLFEPEAVETAVRVFEVNGEYPVVYGKCQTIDETGTVVKEAEGGSLNFEYLLKNGMTPRVFQPGCFFNKQRITREFFLDETYNFAFDYELLLHLYSKASFEFINRAFASYRVHKDAKSTKHADAAYREKIKIQQFYGKKNFYLWQYRLAKHKISTLVKK